MGVLPPFSLPRNVFIFKCFIVQYFKHIQSKQNNTMNPYVPITQLQ